MVTDEELKNMSPEEVAKYQEQNCIFCQIISGKIPSKKIFEDESVLAILDINPANPGHVLIMPKKHYGMMPQIPDAELAHLFITAKKISNILLNSSYATATNTFIANGQAAGQKAPHFMIHVIPRLENDGVNLVPKESTTTPEEIEALKNTLGPKIKEVFNVPDEVMQRFGYVLPNVDARPEEKSAHETGKEEPQQEPQQEPSQQEPQQQEPEKSDENETPKEKPRDSGETVPPIDDEEIDIDKLSNLFK